MTILLLTSLVALCIVVVTVFKTVTKAHASPLSRIPNAGWGAGYSRLIWAFRQEYRGNVTLELPKLHETLGSSVVPLKPLTWVATNLIVLLGPLIRIGPNELSFYSIDIYDTVHKVNSGFVKDPRNYGEFVQDEHPALFSITDPQEHAKRRRILGQLFSRSNIEKLEGLMLHHIDEFVSAVGKRSTSFDIGLACRALEADIISDFSFGEALSAVSAWSKGEEVALVSKNDEKATFLPLIMNFPLLYSIWWTYKAWVQNKDPDRKSQFPNLLNVMVSAGLPTQTALSEAKENLGPGTDTTSASLAHILYALSWNSTYQQKVYQDLASRGFPTDFNTLENIPRLRGCVKEGIRWAGASVAMLPRVVPKGGVELCGNFVPEGTIVTSSPVWYLRDKYAYPNPELFNPYRWIDDSGLNTTEDVLRDKFYVAFSKGANTCIANHFSYLELYMSVAKMVANFEISPANEQHRHAQAAGLNNADWQPVQLPKRKEWVSAVVTEPLLIKTVPRRHV
ncbi:benzoate 4-monooxygenase cytochrome p450 [Colletotrichum scovillei]|uniref:Benzoate 4-monooxygenase cytochrome p450 n=1 Tax=Colletotrichum scovillei TaxID=1209932 RepID=A0A9P7RDC5_9PEZI|nr:benzoate 4-monooxygenase cytochrome p450 [Colletotrichum scovillei]